MPDASSSDQHERMMDARKDVRRENPVSWRGSAGKAAQRQPDKARRQEARRQARETD